MGHLLAIEFQTVEKPILIWTAISVSQ